MTESSNSIEWPSCETSLDAATHDNQILEDQIAQVLDSMSLEQKAGQMIQAEINSITPQHAGDHAIGSILNGGGSFPFGDKHASVSDWLELADSFHRESLNRAGHAVPIIWATDAVHGHNNVYTATMFPHNIGLGATRNFDLMREIAVATARDVVATGIAWTFAPTMAVPLDLRWGRSYEGFSEDPNIVAQCAEAVIVGLQGEVSQSSFLSGDKVLATSKHFVGEGGTTDGKDQGDTICGEAELRHVHSLGHMAALRAGAQVVMAAFKQLERAPPSCAPLPSDRCAKGRDRVQWIRRQRLGRVLSCPHRPDPGHRRFRQRGSGHADGVRRLERRPDPPRSQHRERRNQPRTCRRLRSPYFAG